MRPLLRLSEVELRPADDKLLLEGEVFIEYMAQREYLRLGLVIDEGEHIDGKARLKRGLREEAVEHHLRVRVALELDNYAHAVAVALVSEVGNALKALFVHLIGDVLYKLAAVDLIWQLRHDYSRALVLAVLLKLRARAHDDAPAPCGVGLAYAAAPHDDALCREVGSLDVLHEVIELRVRVIQHAHTGVDDLGEVVGRYIRRHADGDAGRAVDEEIREARGEHARLLARLVEVRVPVDSVLVDVAQHLV